VGDSRTMQVDHNMVWEKGIPYLVLGKFQVTPQSSISEILDVIYSMTPEESSDSELNAAWETLRNTLERLLVDFFCPILAKPAKKKEDVDTVPPLIPMKLIEHMLNSIVTISVPANKNVIYANMPPNFHKHVSIWQIDDEY
jgi:hypothetical protein